MKQDAKLSREMVIERLRQLQPELEAEGIAHASLIGSMARNEHTLDSDIDLYVELDTARKPRGYAGMAYKRELKRHLRDLLGRDVDLIEHPIVAPHLRDQIEREAVRAF